MATDTSKDQINNKCPVVINKPQGSSKSSYSKLSYNTEKSTFLSGPAPIRIPENESADRGDVRKSKLAAPPPPPPPGSSGLPSPPLTPGPPPCMTPPPTRGRSPQPPRPSLPVSPPLPLTEHHDSSGGSGGGDMNISDDIFNALGFGGNNANGTSTATSKLNGDCGKKVTGIDKCDVKPTSTGNGNVTDSNPKVVHSNGQSADSNTANVSSSSSKLIGENCNSHVGYKKSKPAPPPPKPANKPKLIITPKSQNICNGTSSRSTPESDASSSSSSPKLKIRTQRLKSSSIVKPSTPPPAPPPQSKTENKTGHFTQRDKSDSGSKKQVVVDIPSSNTTAKDDAVTSSINTASTANTTGNNAVIGHTAVNNSSTKSTLETKGEQQLSKSCVDRAAVLISASTASSKAEEGNGNINDMQHQQQGLGVEGCDGLQVSNDDKVAVPNDHCCTEINNGITYTGDGLNKTSVSNVNTVENTNSPNSTIRNIAHVPAKRSPKHSRASPVKKRRSFALGLCCGLQGRRTDSPTEMELPLRTEGTLPRGNNDVISPQYDITNNGELLVKSSSELVILPGGESESRKATLKRNIFESVTSCDNRNSQAVNNKEADVNVSHSVSSLSVSDKPVVHDVVKLHKTGKSPMPVRTKSSVGNSHNSVISKTVVDDDDNVFIASHSKSGVGRVISSHSPSGIKSVSISSPVKISHPSVCSSGGEEVKLRKPSQSNTDSQISNIITRDPYKVRSQSVEDLAFIVVDLDLDLASHFERNKNSIRSSFIGEDVLAKPAMFQAPGEFQTLLKHSKMDAEKVYALPQPQSYGESTLKAVKRITEKYDTLQRWQIRAMSFRADGTLVKNSGSTCSVPFVAASRQTSRESQGGEGEASVVDAGAQSQTTDADKTDGAPEVENAAAKTNLVAINKSKVKLNKKEIQRIEIFYQSRETELVVCHCTADVMFASAEGDDYEWLYQFTGIPVLVLNTGEGRRPRELNINMADRETGFILWHDKINYLSQYSPQSATLYTMQLSTSLMKRIGFRFHCQDSAEKFYNKFKEITKDTNDQLWKLSSGGGGGKVKGGKSGKKSNVHGSPVKGDISQPLNFNHVTNIDSRNPNLLVNLGDFLPKVGAAVNVNDLDENSLEFRLRAYSG